MLTLFLPLTKPATEIAAAATHMAKRQRERDREGSNTRSCYLGDQVDVGLEKSGFCCFPLGTDIPTHER